MSNSSTSMAFTKMQGAGNDFVVIDNRDESYSLEELVNLCPQLCDRRLGIGADGLLALFPSKTEGVDFTMVYRNADGSDAGMCGNGARCLSAFAYHLGFASEHKFEINSKVFSAEVSKIESGIFEVTIHFPIETSANKLPNDLFEIYTATEHVVTFCDKKTLQNEEFLREQGSKIRYDQERFPKGTNVNFINGISAEVIELQTYERGVENLTLACGTGAIASAIGWHHKQNEQNPESNTRVQCAGGNLEVSFKYNAESSVYSDISLKGDAVFVFEGQFYQ